MTDKGRFRASGWRGREVGIPDSVRAAGPVVLELKGGLTTSFTVRAMRRSDTHKSYGEQFLGSYGPRARRAMLPGGYNRVEVGRVSPGSNTGSGFARWRLRSLDVSELSVLTDTLSGRNDDVVFFDGPARCSFVWRGRFESGQLRFTSASGGTAREISEQGAIRGEVAVPGKGFLAVSTWGRWTLERL
ncbi:hypothetical protein [Streptomyces sp. NPDC059452]|uniref:hypothetical protein n=1 Tax=Streptomyces sp. NPDC059452 TaxID=3346835 RepID=UPI00367C78B7